AYVFHLGMTSGTPCTMAAECAVGFCVDGVCCNSACAGGALDCQACSQAAGAPADGTCAPLAAGTTCGSGADASHSIAGGSCDGVATACNLTPAAGTVTCDSGGDPNQCIASYQCDGKAAGSCPTTNPIPLRSTPSCASDPGTGMPPQDGSAPSGCQCQLG